jgi:hypothetical protein
MPVAGSYAHARAGATVDPLTVTGRPESAPAASPRSSASALIHEART